MKAAIKTIAHISLTGILLVVLVHTLLAKGNDNGTDKPVTVSEQTGKDRPVSIEKAEPKKFPGVKVKNIWKDMPSYDKYGNLVTAKARFNMEQNRLNVKNENNKSNNNLAQEIK